MVFLSGGTWADATADKEVEMTKRKFIEEAAAAVCFVVIVVAMFVMLAVWG